MKSRVLGIAAVVGLGAAVVLAATAASGPDIEGCISRGLALYKAGKTAEAIVSLQQAISAMQKSLEGGMSALFPKAPDGWQAGEIQSQSVSGSGGGSEGLAWTHLTRTYTHKADTALTVEVSLTNSKELIEPQKAVIDTYKNPQLVAMMAAQGVKITPIDQDGWAGWMVVQKDGNAQAMAFQASYMLQVNVSKPDEKTLKAFWDAIDRKALAPAKTTP